MRARAFTLLEVMVAVAILGLALTVILSAQTGLYSSSGYAQRVSIATGLARCRMTEVEERLLKYGFPELDDENDGPCCDDESREDFTCSWKVEKVTLPDLPVGGGDAGTQGGLGSLAGGFGGPASGGPASPLGDLGAMGGLGSGLGSSSGGPLGMLGQLASGAAFSGDAGLSGVASQLGQGSSLASGLAPMAMTFVYPTLKPLLEASIRKITVKVIWRAGIRKQDLTVSQYVTHPSRGFPPGMGGADGGAPVGTASPLNFMGMPTK